MSRFDWIQNQFHVEVEKICHLTLKVQEEFAELSSDSSLKTMFAKMSLNSFWVGIKLEYPNLSRLAMDTFLPFATYLCESAFSSLTNLKTKHRASLGDTETVLRPALTKIEPRFDLLCKKMQAHQSH